VPVNVKLIVVSQRVAVDRTIMPPLEQKSIL